MVKLFRKRTRRRDSPVVAVPARPLSTEQVGALLFASEAGGLGGRRR